MAYSDLNEGFEPINPRVLDRDVRTPSPSYDPRMMDSSASVSVSSPASPASPAPGGFKHTGNEVQVSADELVSFMKGELRYYDQLTREGKVGENDVSPYRDPWVYTTADNKQVQVPPQIQQMAIDEWSQQREILDHARSQQQGGKSTGSSQNTERSVQSASGDSASKMLTVDWLENKLIWFVLGMAAMYLIVRNRMMTLV